VKIYDRDRLVRTVLLKRGRATLRLLLPSLGRHTLRAVYRGSRWAAPSSTSITVHIVRKP
jgi:hypothetical protein